MDSASANYWNQRYSQGGSSGYGSYGEQLEKKLNWITPLDYNSITEIGCGDFNFGKNLLKRHPTGYVGYDVAPAIIEANTFLFPDREFHVLDDKVLVPSADLVLCVDVLFHVLEDEEYEKLLDRLELLWTKYLVVTAYEYDKPATGHVCYRTFDVKRFGEPILKETIEEDGNLQFFLFKR